MKKPIAFRIDENLLKRIDAARVDTPRTQYIEEALREKLSNGHISDPPPKVANAIADAEKLTEEADVELDKLRQERKRSEKVIARTKADQAVVQEAERIVAPPPRPKTHFCKRPDCTWPGAYSAVPCPIHGYMGRPR